MHPAAVSLLPVAALVLAGTTLSAVPTGREHPGLPSSSASTSAPSWNQLAAAVPRDSSRAPSPALRGRWAWPLQPQPAVVRPFVRPATTYGAGHRGADLTGTAQQEVHAVEAGTVTHVGSIAGRGTVSVLHASGIRSTYEPVESAVVAGSAVARGAVLGRLDEQGSHCGAAVCLHLGAIRGDVYLDPLTFLEGGRRVRLLPLAP